MKWLAFLLVAVGTGPRPATIAALRRYGALICMRARGTGLGHGDSARSIRSSRVIDFQATIKASTTAIVIILACVCRHMHNKTNRQ